jgi:hypothetical protein
LTPVLPSCNLQQHSVTTDQTTNQLLPNQPTTPQIACLLEANRVSAAAHEALWAACAPGSSREYHLESAFRAACMEGGLRQLGYPCIVSHGVGVGGGVGVRGDLVSNPAMWSCCGGFCSTVVMWN